MRIEGIIQPVLSRILDTYPGIADMEDDPQAPYAVYKIKTTDILTKESVKSSFEVGIFVVADGYDESQELTSRIRSAVYNLQLKPGNACTVPLSVSPVTYSTDFDQEDRKYVTEITFTLKFL